MSAPAKLRKLNTLLQARVRIWVNSVITQTDNSMLAQLKMTGALNLVTQFVGKAIPFARRNGFKVIALRPGYIKALIPLKGNSNHFNAMYAGALFTLAEIPGGIIPLLSFDERFVPILKDLKIEFIKMAKTDVTVEYELSESLLAELGSAALREGKTEFVLQGELKDAQGSVVASSSAKYQLRIQ